MAGESESSVTLSGQNTGPSKKQNFLDLVAVLVLISIGVYGTFSGWQLTGVTVNIVILLIILGAGAYLIVLGARDVVIARRIATGPTSSIGSIEPGPVSLKGKARPLKPQKSPIGGEPSAYWRVTGENFILGGKAGTGSWHEVHAAAAQGPFLLEDMTGRVLIEPAGSEIEAHTASYSGIIGGSKVDDTMDQRGLDYIDSLQEGEQKALLAHDLVCLTENWIPENEPIVVLGHAILARENQDLEANARFIVKKGFLDGTMYIADSQGTRITLTRCRWMYPKIAAGICIEGACVWCFPFLSQIGNNIATSFLFFIAAAFIVGYFVTRKSWESWTFWF